MVENSFWASKLLVCLCRRMIGMGKLMGFCARIVGEPLLRSGKHLRSSVLIVGSARRFPVAGVGCLLALLPRKSLVSSLVNCATVGDALTPCYCDSGAIAGSKSSCNGGTQDMVIRTKCAKQCTRHNVPGAVRSGYV